MLPKKLEAEKGEQMVVLSFSNTGVCIQADSYDTSLMGMPLSPFHLVIHDAKIAMN